MTYPHDRTRAIERKLKDQRNRALTRYILPIEAATAAAKHDALLRDTIGRHRIAGVAGELVRTSSE